MFRHIVLGAATLAAGAFAGAAAAAAWEPTKNVETSFPPAPEAAPTRWPA